MDESHKCRSPDECFAGTHGEDDQGASPRLSDAEWEAIRWLLPTRLKSGSLDSREFIEAVVFLSLEQIDWCCLPDRYGAFHSAYVRFTRWCHAGIWDGVLARISDPVVVSALRNKVQGYLTVHARRTAKKRRS